jgi:aldehyde:ferredoxin oxidoreductase
MSIRERVTALLPRLAREPQFATQGRTLFVDLEREEVQAAHTPRHVVESLLEGRGGNMFYLYNLLDPSLEPLSPEIPFIFGSGILTGIVPSAARGNATSWSPDSGVLMDCNVGDYFPSFLRLNGIQRLVLYGRAKRWAFLCIHDGEVEFLDGERYRGLDNIDLRERVAADFDGVWARDLAMLNITSAGENLVLTSGVMGGPKALLARGGPGAKLGAMRLKGILIQGKNPEIAAAAAYKPANSRIAQQLLRTSVVQNALSIRGTPFLYKPSRLLGAMGTKNNQEMTWTDKLDAEELDETRSGMAGCFRCPVNCRPLNDLRDFKENPDRYDVGDGPEYVTLGKFGPNLGIDDKLAVQRLNNICNDLGLDTASTGSAIGWAMELYQRGVLTKEHTGGLELKWGDAALVEKLLFMMAGREGIGDAIADSGRAVETGKYPPEARRFRMAVKGLFQSDPHDARILKAFALGLAVATRGMDHLRNRVTLEINARINDDPAFKERLYGAPISPEPNGYETKEIAVRLCENIYGVGDSVGMCRFTTYLFNSPTLPGYEVFSEQLQNVAGLDLDPGRLDRVGLRINWVERMVNHRLGVRKEHDTLPDRWFDEPVTVGPFKGERIDREQFARMLDRFYEISGLNGEGIPRAPVLEETTRLLTGFAVKVRVPDVLQALPEGTIVVAEPVKNVRELLAALDDEVPGLGTKAKDSMFNVVVNGEMLLQGADDAAVADGDEVEILPALSGG